MTFFLPIHKCICVVSALAAAILIILAAGHMEQVNILLVVTSLQVLRRQQQKGQIERTSVCADEYCF